ncbi:MAG: hypothetical protein HYY64_00965 [Candidatus Rokubacteria bacterium]|nr:hypothetical protein [Candidatus Rokubacteria bacterium]
MAGSGRPEPAAGIRRRRPSSVIPMVALLVVALGLLLTAEVRGASQPPPAFQVDAF